MKIKSIPTPTIEHASRHATAGRWVLDAFWRDNEDDRLAYRKDGEGRYLVDVVRDGERYTVGAVTRFYGDDHWTAIIDLGDGEETIASGETRRGAVYIAGARATDK